MKGDRSEPGQDTSLEYQMTDGAYHHLETTMENNLVKDCQDDKQMNYLAEAGSQAARQPGSQAARQPGSQAARQPGSQAARQPGRQAARQPGRQAGRQPGRQAGRQANLFIFDHTYILIFF